jgi:hypothetical protein
MAQGESKLSRQIMSALRARGVWCMKIHGGPTMMAGAPDIIACVPVTVWGDPDTVHWGPDQVGLFVGFETKTPTGGDPTPVQQHVHEQIRSAHGMVFVPRSVEDAVKALESVGWRDPGE